MRLAAVGESSQRLNADDVRVLLHHNDEDTRANVIRKISYVFHYASLNRKEQETAVQIFRLILQDKSVVVRKTMAEVLKTCGHVPVDIVQALASDMEDDVASPMLQYSELLSEQDLQVIVEATDAMVRLLAIANRYRVPMRVANALVEKRMPKVVLALVENQGADISGALYLKIANDFGNEQHLLPALKQRNPLPMAAIARVTEIQRKLRTNDNDEVAAENVSVVTAYRVATGEIAHYYRSFCTLPEKVTPLAYERLTDEMHSMLRLNSFSLLTGLMLGHEGFFVTALAKKLRLPLMKAEEICQHPYSPMFVMMCENARLVDAQIHWVQWLLTEVRRLRADGVRPGVSMLEALEERLTELRQDGLLLDDVRLMEMFRFIVALAQKG